MCSPCSEQARLRQQVVEDDTEEWQSSPDFSGLERVGGVDLSFIKGDNVNACAQLVVLSYPNMKVSCPVSAHLNWSTVWVGQVGTAAAREYFSPLKPPEFSFIL